MIRPVLVSAFVTLVSVIASAAPGDLVLPGERWLARFDKYTCQPFQPAAAARPGLFEAMNVQVEGLSTDYSLDNVLFLAAFTEDGSPCRYSALLFADNAAQTVRVVQSKAFSPTGGSTCVAGKSVFDQLLGGNVKYIYGGRNHRMVLPLAFPDSQAVCGAGSGVVGLEFVVSGRRP